MRRIGTQVLDVYIISVKQRSKVLHQYTMSNILTTHNDRVKFMNVRSWVIKVPPQCHCTGAISAE